MVRVLAPLLLNVALVAGLPTQQEALALAFPGAQITRHEHFLTEAQAKGVQEQAGTALSGLWQVAYEARKEGRLVGVGFFDTHRVRTLNETALIAVSAEGRILRVEVVAFKEPEEYRAKEAWIHQLDGKRLDPELSLKRSIRPLAGATLTANALTDASRRGLALFQVLYGGKG
ncbi:MAG TPA: FMN-binding protein [Holophagaceae bacterium]|nr:FMN-binding protein [Holophagaceae bacterium]